MLRSVMDRLTDTDESIGGRKKKLSIQDMSQEEGDLFVNASDIFFENKRKMFYSSLLKWA